MNEQPQVHHPIFARFYERFAARREGPEIRERRRGLVEGLSGRVLDLGAGTGVNFGLFGDGVRELHRVIRPGGELRFYEHVRAGPPAGRALQRALDATVWPLLAGGCHMSRDTVTAIGRAGFDVEDVRPVRFVLPQPPIPFVIGCARRR